MLIYDFISWLYMVPLPLQLNFLVFSREIEAYKGNGTSPSPLSVSEFVNSGKSRNRGLPKGETLRSYSNSRLPIYRWVFEVTDLLRSAFIRVGIHEYIMRYMKSMHEVYKYVKRPKFKANRKIGL